MTVIPQELFRLGSSKIRDAIASFSALDHRDFVAAAKKFVLKAEGFEALEFFNQEVNATTWDRVTVVRNVETGQFIAFCASGDGSAAVYADPLHMHETIINAILEAA